MLIVTSGARYIDIDAYASIIAYAKFLNLKGKNALAYSSSPLNESVTTSLRNNKYTISTHVDFNNDDKFIILDVSDPNFFDKSVDMNRNIQIIDHHYGFENYWDSNSNINTIIENIGAVATIIFELYEKENLLDSLDKDICLLLMAAILDNTLNFKAKPTTSRDINAYTKLEKLANLNFNYAEFYFNECEKEIKNNLKKAILNDTKLDNTGSKVPHVFAQLAVWDASNIIENINLVHEALSTFKEPWLMNLISLKDVYSFLISNDDTIKSNIEQIFKCTFNNDIAILPDVWLRKEIIKKLL